MKKLIIVLLAFVAMLFGCSEDTLLNDIAKSADENALQSEMVKDNKGKPVEKTIKMRGSGKIVYTLVGLNDDGMQVYSVAVEAHGNASHLGLFTTNLNWFAVYAPITDEFGVPIEPITYTFYPLTPPKGIQIAANGDELNTFLSDYDPNGEWYEYSYENGTGRFENVSGKIKLYQTMEMIDDLNGVFSNYGEGWIKY